jgi:hypothetical protein
MKITTKDLKASDDVLIAQVASLLTRISKLEAAVSATRAEIAMIKKRRARKPIALQWAISQGGEE